MMKKLKEFRQNNGFTYSEMSKLTNTETDYAYKRLENGKVKPNQRQEKAIKKLFSFQKNLSFQLEVCFDWMSVRFKTTNTSDVILNVLKLPVDTFFEDDYALYGYDSMRSWGNIHILSSTNQDLGTLIIMSGQGCRQYEEYLMEELKKEEWYDFFNRCFLYEEKWKIASDGKEIPRFLKFTRLDLALDEKYDKGFNYDLWTLLKKIHRGCVKTNKHEIRNVGTFLPRDNLSSGMSIYFGGKSANPLLRFYEKDYERASALGVSVEYVNKVLGFKNRYEIKITDDLAMDFIKRYIKEYFDIGEEAVKFINGSVKVFEDPAHQSLDTDWYSLVGATAKYKYSPPPKEKALAINKKWTEDNVLPTIKFWAENDPKWYEEMMKHTAPSKKLEKLKALEQAKNETERLFQNQTGEREIYQPLHPLP
ncbi:replication initiation factor domain-containing protein [Lactococcus lactis]|uniref:Replication initiation factor domain-containing protein n=1 Tax=Lactococcus lactis TaxID=1358 RepID=A0A9X4S535_9LACT|nr:replication initiation factor domain-containing protein [Lactococcus lactis]MDG4983917.1 replication initiation factor domain-containing protein [Lactococcus lactis]